MARRKKEGVERRNIMMTDKADKLLNFAAGNAHKSRSEIVNALILQKLADPRNQIREIRQYHIDQIEELNRKLDLLDDIKQDQKSQEASKQLVEKKVIL